MDRERGAIDPAVAARWQALADRLPNYAPVEGRYLGSVGTRDGEIAIIFGARQMADRLNVATTLNIENASIMELNEPRQCHLLIIHILQRDVGFPAVYILSDSRTPAMYDAILTFIVNMVPELRNLLQSVVISNVGRAFINAFRRFFPEVPLTCSWFDCCRDVFKKWRETVNRRAPKEVLWMILAVPLVTINEEHEAMRVVQGATVAVQGRFPEVQRVFDYFRQHWLPLADVLTIGQTDDICESVQKLVRMKLLGRYRNIWEFFDKLTSFIDRQNVEWDRAARGIRLRRAIGARHIQDERRLLHDQERLESGRITIGNFLRKAVTANRRRSIETLDIRDRGQEYRWPPEAMPRREDFQVRAVAILADDEVDANNAEPARAVVAPPAAAVAPPAAAEEGGHQFRPCCICFERRPVMVFLPCGHVVTCAQCNDIHRVYQNECPICRSVIEQRIRGYF